MISDLKKSIAEFGMVDPIIVNSAPGRENVVIGGHFRLFVAKELKMKEVPVVYVNVPSLKKEQELNLRLNKNLGDWDWDVLANFDEEMLLDVGFEELELDQHLGLEGFDENLVSQYPFGTINSWVRIGDFGGEIEDPLYQKLKEKIELAGGLKEFLERIIQS